MKFKLTGTITARTHQSYEYGGRILVREVERLQLPFKLNVTNTSASFNSYKSGQIFEDGSRQEPSEVKYKEAIAEQYFTYVCRKDNGGKLFERLEIAGKSIEKWHQENGEQKQFYTPYLHLQTWDRQELFVDITVLEKVGSGKRAWHERHVEGEIVALDDKSQAILANLLNTYQNK